MDTIFTSLRTQKARGSSARPANLRFETQSIHGFLRLGFVESLRYNQNVYIREKLDTRRAKEETKLTSFEGYHFLPQMRVSDSFTSLIRLRRTTSKECSYWTHAQMKVRHKRRRRCSVCAIVRSRRRSIVFGCFGHDPTELRECDRDGSSIRSAVHFRILVAAV